MANVTFIKDGQKITVSVEEGKSVLQAAIDNGISMDSACGGNGVCTTCMIKVHEGENNLGGMTEQEEIMGMDPNDRSTRLGCQTQISGDVTIEPAF